MDIDSNLLNALIQVESSNNPQAFNPNSKARGLTQITPIAWEDLVMHYPQVYGNLNYEQDVFKPEIAKRAGTDYLNVIQKYLKAYNIPTTLDNVLAAYNWGVGNLKKLGMEKAPKETRDYIQKIKTLMEMKQND